MFYNKKSLTEVEKKARQEKLKGYLLLSFTILCFSTMEVVSAPWKKEINPLSMTFLRFLMGGLFLLPFILLKREKLTKKDFLFFFGLGALNIFVSMSCLQAAVYFGKASTAAMLISSNPIFVMIFSAILLKEKLSRKRTIAIGLGILGLGFIMSRFGTGGDTLLGILFGVSASITFGLYTVLGKGKSATVSSLSMIGYSSLLGCICYVPIFLYKGMNPFIVPRGSLPTLLYMGIALSGLAYITYVEALKILGAGKGSVTFFCKPAIASALAVIFLGEKLTLNGILGSAIIIVGMAVNFSPEKSFLHVPKKE